MMMGSREAVVDYMTPLGLHHLMARGHHYGPGPWVERPTRRLDLGLLPPRRRQRASASIAARGAATPSRSITRRWRRSSANVQTVPEQFLLWFHHVPWDYRTVIGPHAVGRTGVSLHARRRSTSARCASTWAGLGQYVDAERFAQVRAFLAIQEKEAQWWRDACIAYFQTFSKRPLPAGFAPPAHPLEYYQALKFPYAPGR